MTTSARKPPEKPSDEADRHQIAMAKKEGAAYHASLKYMAEEVADSGGMKRAGDYIVAYAQERAEGMYMLKGKASSNGTRRRTKTAIWRFPSATPATSASSPIWKSRQD
ncbi:hypothetical protein N7E02_04340 (plasmid) [Aliirhizobium terrae]|uniref:hypothetical protein n=1 Tax=Terrirhizobium terrae TaxID=2926709 RepID=UPI002576FEBA|nr:hypothetical protein [Rhizobium sp. CC-CFT758]WJH38630.1 hypothetical protein N7E02_04340 [Rhizobium sp. CC-CFT758]